MKQRKNDLLRTIRLAAILLSGAILAHGTASADVIYPNSLVVKSGDINSSSVKVLQTYDQMSSQDVSSGYIQFSSTKQALTSIFSFKAPAGSLATSLAIDVNYKGPPKSLQTWRIQLYDNSQRKWFTVGDNADAGNLLWSQMSYKVPSNPQRFMDSSGNIRARYQSINPQTGYSSALDYLAVRLNDDSDTGSGLTGSLPNLPPGTSWQMQLSGAVNTTYDADVYDIDLFDTPQSVIDALHAQGRTVICYFSAGSWENWRPDANAFPVSVKGKSNGWAGEKWLNIAALDKLTPIMSRRLDKAVARGCDGVDPDNVDGYLNDTGFRLTAANQLRYNRWLAAQAHARGLLVGLKNDLDQIEELVNDFDFAVNEQCEQYRECDMLSPFIEQNKLVIQIEYGLAPEKFCSKANAADRDAQKKSLSLDSKVIADCRADY